MKRYITGFILAVSIIIAGSCAVGIPIASAQGITLQQLVQLFISLGIISSDKVAAAEAAVGLPVTGMSASVATTTALSLPEPLITLVGTPSISTSQSPTANGNPMTVITATFNLSIHAVGDSFSFKNATTEPFAFFVYKNGAEASETSVYSPLESFAVPSSGVITTGLSSGTAFKLPQNNTITLPVTVSFIPIGSGTANYAVKLTGVESFASGGQLRYTGLSSYYYDNSPWLTSAVSATAVPASITVTSPSAGQTYHVGDKLNINWNSSNYSEEVNIDLNYQNGATAVGAFDIASVQNTGNYSWTIPSNYIPTSSSGLYKVTVWAGTPVTGSSGWFTIGGNTVTTTQTPVSPTTSSSQTTSAAYHGTNYTAGAVCPQQLTNLLISAGIIPQSMASAAIGSAIANQSLPFSELVGAYVSLGYISQSQVPQANAIVANATAGSPYQACLSSFTPTAPGITSLTPSSGPAGTAVTITGINLGTNNTVIISGITTINTSSNGSTIQFTIPQNTPAGSYYVGVTNNSSNTSANNLVFTVTGSQSVQTYASPTTNSSQTARGMCGSAQGVASVVQPTANLCSSGSASNQRIGPNSVNWLWDCAVNNPNDANDVTGCYAAISQ